MTIILTSLVVGVVASIIGNYIYDKFIKYVADRLI